MQNPLTNFSFLILLYSHNLMPYSAATELRTGEEEHVWEDRLEKRKPKQFASEYYGKQSLNILKFSVLIPNAHLPNAAR